MCRFMSIPPDMASIRIGGPITTRLAENWARNGHWNFSGRTPFKKGPIHGCSLMKSIVASIFAVSLLAAPAAMADGIGAGVHVGPIGVGAHIGGDDHRDYHS